MSVLNLRVTNRILEAVDIRQIFSGTQNIDSLQVTFDSEWNGFSKMAVFSVGEKDCFFSDLDSNGRVVIPAAVLEKSGTIRIGMIGEKTNQRITSSLLLYRVGCGAAVKDLLDGSAVDSLLNLLTRALSDNGGVTGTRRGATFTPSVSSDGLISWTNDLMLDNPTPVNIRGPEGASIQSMKAYYARSLTATAPSSGFSTSAPALTSTYRYLWCYLEFTMSNGVTLTTSKSVIGVFGNKGDTGADGFSPILSASKDGWTTTVSVTDSTGTRDLAVIHDGISITAFTRYFLKTSMISGVTAETSGWQTTLTVPTSSEPQVWSYVKVDFNDGSSISTAPVMLGNYNDRLTTIATCFLKTNTDSTPSTSTSGWTTVYSEPTAELPYLWCCLRFAYAPYGVSSSHYVYSPPFRLDTYKASGTGAAGVVLDTTNPYNINDKNMGNRALEAVRSGIMPVIYTGSSYVTVTRAEAVSYCGINYLRLYYPMTSCSGYVLTSIDWQTS